MKNKVGEGVKFCYNVSMKSTSGGSENFQSPSTASHCNDHHRPQGGGHALYQGLLLPLNINKEEDLQSPAGW